MYIVKPDGSIECQTAKEAIDLQRLIQSTRIEPRRISRERPAKQPVTQPVNDDESAEEIAKKLEQYYGAEISSAELMPIIGAKAPSGVGSKLYHLQNRIPISDYVKLTKHRDEKGVVTWRVRKVKTL